MSDEEKKIIIDEDWKSQVQAEKEAAEKAKQEDPTGAESAAAAGGQMPPADLQTIISMFATQAMMCLGAMPNPVTGKAEVSFEQARHFIDLIGVLQEKTQGNCSPEESNMLENILHELRMSYLAMQKIPQAEPPAEESKIETES